jgi:hypothetical protein
MVEGAPLKNRDSIPVSCVFKALQGGKFPSRSRRRHDAGVTRPSRPTAFVDARAGWTNRIAGSLGVGQLVIVAGRHPEPRGQPRARVPDIVGTRLPSPYHFRARIQSFQAVAAPFPGDSVSCRQPLAPRSRDQRSAMAEYDYVRNRPQRCLARPHAGERTPPRGPRRRDPYVVVVGHALAPRPRERKPGRSEDLTWIRFLRKRFPVFDNYGDRR